MNLQLVFHFVVEGKFGLRFSKMLAVLRGFLDAKLEIVPLYAEFLHHFRSLLSLLICHLIAIFWLFLVPFIEHLLEVGVQ